MSALVTALLLGLAVSWTKAEIINKALAELEAIMTSVVTGSSSHPAVFVGATFCELSYEGRLTVQFPIFLKVIGIVIVGHFIWLAVLYSIGGILSGRNPWRVLRYYLPRTSPPWGPCPAPPRCPWPCPARGAPRP